MNNNTSLNQVTESPESLQHPDLGRPQESASYLTDGFVGCLPLSEGDESVAPVDYIIEL